MKTLYALIPFALLALAGQATAQTSIWRCGNTYTNDQKEATAKACKLVEGGNVTVVQGTKVASKPVTVAAAAAPQSAASPQRVDSGDQKARDSDARAILEAELKKAEARQAELQKEYNNGEPEKMGPEHKNHQKYLDRVAELKAAIDRNANDIAGLKRELSRTAATAAK